VTPSIDRMPIKSASRGAPEVYGHCDDQQHRSDPKTVKANGKILPPPRGSRAAMHLAVDTNSGPATMAWQP
jgi:hypothetical protein